jgi:hypothetical protein
MTITKPGRKPGMTSAARGRRDRMIIDLFLAGHNEQAIADRPDVNLRKDRVRRIVKAELDRATKDYILRNENAMVIWMARMEILVREAFSHVTEGNDLKAIEVCRRLMADQAKVYDLAEDEVNTARTPPISDAELDDGEPLDELAAYRAQRSQQAVVKESQP